MLLWYFELGIVATQLRIRCSSYIFFVVKMKSTSKEKSRLEDCYSSKPVDSTDDVFTDEQPEVLEEPLPVLENNGSNRVFPVVNGVLVRMRDFDG